MQWFRRESECDLGSGVCYLEFDGQSATRQAEQYGDRWFASATRADFHIEIGGGLCEKSLDELAFDEREAISREEFERAWRAALGG